MIMVNSDCCEHFLDVFYVFLLLGEAGGRPCTRWVALRDIESV